MKYRLGIKSSASKSLEGISAPAQGRIDEKILELESDPRPPGSRRLKSVRGKPWRLAVGDYRVIYTIDDKNRSVLVVKIDHRSEVYKRGLGN